ncbi:hypothetical protein [Massilia consociata]|uniref:Uncharacterized protein n=1 Tax=Massilia consociata TaxID=760117 RepID=A0ABV6FLX8_9BURK
MKSRMKASVLACVLAGSASGAVAQGDCYEKISTIQKIGDVQSALSCVEGRVAAEAERFKQHTESHKKQLFQQIVDQLELVTTNVRHVSFKESTNGAWKQIPDSANADACFLSSVRLPAQGLCQVTYQGAQGRWTYNVSDPASAGFTCTATCVWMDIRLKEQGGQ